MQPRGTFYFSNLLYPS